MFPFLVITLSNSILVAKNKNLNKKAYLLLIPIILILICNIFLSLLNGQLDSNNKIIKRFRPIHSMSYIIKCQLLDRIRFIQTGSAQCIVIRIYILILTQGVKIECTSHRVNLAYRTGHPIPGSDFIFKFPSPSYK